MRIKDMITQDEFTSCFNNNFTPLLIWGFEKGNIQNVNSDLNVHSVQTVRLHFPKNNFGFQLVPHHPYQMETKVLRKTYNENKLR